MLIGGVLLVGCGRHSESTFDDGPQSLEAVAKHLSKATPDETNPLHLSVEAIPLQDPVTLRCVLTNVSAKPVRLRELALPCANWSTLHVRGLTTAGQFLPMRPPVGSVLSADPPPEITVMPGETVLRELSLDAVYPLAENSRDIDVLLLWSYRRDPSLSTGIALLPRHKPG
jgi:hypothetical protein